MSNTNGRTPDLPKASSETTPSIREDNTPSEQLRQRITDICFETGSVPLPMINKLEQFITQELKEAERVAWLAGYDAGGQDALTKGEESENA